MTVRPLFLLACVVLTALAFAAGTPPPLLVKNNIPLLPLKYVCEWAGAEVTVSAKGNEILVIRGEITAGVMKGSPMVVVNDEPSYLPLPVEEKNGVTYAALPFFTEKLRLKATWDPKAKQVQITHPARGVWLVLKTAKPTGSSPLPLQDAPAPGESLKWTSQGWAYENKNDAFAMTFPANWVKIPTLTAEVPFAIVMVCPITTEGENSGYGVGAMSLPAIPRATLDLYQRAILSELKHYPQLTPGEAGDLQLKGLTTRKLEMTFQLQGEDVKLVFYLMPYRERVYVLVAFAKTAEYPNCTAQIDAVLQTFTILKQKK
ncbi:MAG: copper amine oxidase N-terminal domain-containing protein [Armatimonadota bacterium]